MVIILKALVPLKYKLIYCHFINKRKLLTHSISLFIFKIIMVIYNAQQPKNVAKDGDHVVGNLIDQKFINISSLKRGDL
jgi:hypothetical protein